MKLLIYSHGFAPNIGGVETYVMLLAQGLAERVRNGEDNLQVTVATPTAVGTMNDATLPFRVVRQPSFASLLKLIWQSDVIHSAGPCLLPMVLGLALGKRVTVEHHGYQAACPNGLLLFEPTKTVCPDHFMSHRYHKCVQCNAAGSGWIGSFSQLVLSFPRRFACKRVALNVAITSHVSTRMRLPRTKVIYYGIPDPLSDASTAIEERQASIATPVTFAYVGRLVSEKGLPLLLEAARQLTMDGCDFHLKFIGDGPERSYLEEQVKALGLCQRVTFTGYLRGEVLQSALSSVAAVVMPSIWEETAGLSAIEQMMRGRLVIGADVGGLGEVVSDGGLRFRSGDVEALTACLRRVLDEPDLREGLGKQARARATEVFGVERMLVDHMRVFCDSQPYQRAIGDIADTGCCQVKTSKTR